MSRDFCNMTENQQVDCVQSRQAGFARHCLIIPGFPAVVNERQGVKSPLLTHPPRHGTIWDRTGQRRSAPSPRKKRSSKLWQNNTGKAASSGARTADPGLSAARWSIPTSSHHRLTGVLATHPPMTYISGSDPPGIPNDLIRESGEFVINLPTSAMMKATDFCGVQRQRRGQVCTVPPPQSRRRP